MAESCSSVQNVSWDEFLSDDLMILECDQVESSFEIKKEKDDRSSTSGPLDSNKENNGSSPSENNIEKELLDFYKHQQNPSTIAKTRRESDRFLKFLREQGENRKPEQFPPKLLDPFIRKFLKELKQEKTGKEYEPGTITNYHRYVQTLFIRRK